MSEVVIEPVGGFTGAGGPGALKSEGRMSMASLSTHDRAALETLMAAPEADAANFGYRVTLHGPDGSTTRTVSADQIPAALVASIKTEFR